jgi:hypothetical protein
MLPKGRQTPAGVPKLASAATLASAAQAAAFAPQFAGVAFSTGTILAFFNCTSMYKSSAGVEDRANKTESLLSGHSCRFHDWDIGDVSPGSLEKF